MSRLFWQHTWPEKGKDFVLLRDRDPAADPEPEHIGRILRKTGYGDGSSNPGWSWSLTSCAHPVGIARPTFETSGFETERQDAADALKAAWSQEEAWRAEVVAGGLPEGMAPYMRRSDHREAVAAEVEQNPRSVRAAPDRGNPDMI